MPSDKQTIGFNAEKEAAKHLRKLGYRIIDKNFRCKLGEIDIIAKHREYLVFVEVKMRSSVEYGTPAQAVTHRKQRNIIRTAQYYIAIKRLECAVRFDVVEIVDREIGVIQDAFA